MISTTFWYNVLLNKVPEKQGGKGMRKKLISVLLTVAMTATLLAGCGGSAGSSTDGTENVGGG